MEGFMEAYGWTLDTAMRHTLPQIFMINHASSYNYERAKRRAKLEMKEHTGDGEAPVKMKVDNPGKPDFSTMSSEAIVHYVCDWEDE